MNTSCKKKRGYLLYVICAPVLGVILYLLTAPPLMMAMTRHSPREWPRFYDPVKYGFWCDSTRPLFNWYFDTVWGADTEIRGE